MIAYPHGPQQPETVGRVRSYAPMLEDCWNLLREIRFLPRILVVFAEFAPLRRDGRGEPSPTGLAGALRLRSG